MYKSKDVPSNRDGTYVRIRVLLLGERTMQVSINKSYNDVCTYRINREKEIHTDTIVEYISHADIVLLVADMNDSFTMENISSIIEILDKNKSLYVNIIANSSKDTLASSCIIIENQEDLTIKNESSMFKKLEIVTNEFCELIDNKIVTTRMHDYTFSSLSHLKYFFSKGHELFLYLNCTNEKIKTQLDEGKCFKSYIETSAYVWTKLSHDNNSSNLREEFVNIIENNADEDADVYYYGSYGDKYSHAMILLQEPVS